MQPRTQQARNDTLVLIPAHNEGLSIHKVVQSVRRETGWPVVVIDDASCDDTAAEAEAAGALVIHLPFSLGAWGAIQTGMLYAARQGCRQVVTMDGDEQHLAHSLHTLSRQLQRTGADVVIGSCPERAGRLRRAVWRVLRLITGLRIEDLTSGLRIYRHTTFPLLSSPHATLLEFQDVGVLMLLRSGGMRVVETPVPMAGRTFGRSRVFSSSLKILYYLAYSFVLCLGKGRS